MLPALMAQTHSTFCRICEALCGLEADVEGNKVVAIRPNPKHVATKGFACKKGLEQHHIYDHPDRVRDPLARRGDRFERVSWEQALSEIGAKVQRLNRERGADSIAMYVGTAAGFSALHPVFAQGFMLGLGSKSSYATSTQDCANKFAVARHVYGFPFRQPFPDLRRMPCLTNAARLKRAFEELELLVTVDLFRNETGELAHYILPATSPLERPDLPFIFPLMLGLQAKPYLQATERLIEPEGEVRDEPTIYMDLCKHSGVNLFGSVVAQKAFEAMMFANEKVGEKKRAIPQARVLDLLLRLCGQKSFRALLGDRDGALRDDHEPGSFLGKRVYTTDGKVQLAPLAILREARGAIGPLFEREKSSANALKLITKRHVTTHNSWTHNHESFVKGTDRDTNHLYVHPEDAQRLGLEEGALADVSTDVATVRLPVRLLDELDARDRRAAARMGPSARQGAERREQDARRERESARGGRARSHRAALGHGAAHGVRRRRAPRGGAEERRLVGGDLNRVYLEIRSCSSSVATSSRDPGSASVALAAKRGGRVGSTRHTRASDRRRYRARSSGVSQSSRLARSRSVSTNSTHSICENAA
jgi:anaerobic selenocysteine-containing dehydrogenase